MAGKTYRQALIDKIDASVTQSEIMAGSVRTAYLSAGSGRPVICLHGAGAGAITWYPSIGSMSKCYHVIVPDIVGYGESDKPDATYNRHYFSQWLKNFLLSLNIPKAHIVGLSQGGAIALQFSLDNPQMMEKLVLVDSGGLGAKPPFFSLMGMVWLNSFPSVMANRFYSSYILFNPNNRDPLHGKYSMEVINSKGGKNAFRQGRGAAISPISVDLLRQIQANTLIIWGEDDKLFSIKYGEAATKLIPNSTFCRIPNAGHLPLMDQPDIFNKVVLDFLGSQKQWSVN